MIRCKNCGNIDYQDNRFCTNCGHNFESADFVPPPPHIWKTTEENFLTSEKENPRKVENSARTTFLESANYNQNTPPAFQPANYCWRCQKHVFPIIDKKISTAGWVVFAILLIAFFPLFWIGFLIKEEVRYCPYCYLQISHHL
ncbi:MAG: LITAF-like zinc ribbon domain-containing protein [Pyrinomonadaceae bacterium]|nr:LITAF-like zinc ribbon domain-containing protein [Pyrinomonadaceae bacterium]